MEAEREMTEPWIFLYAILVKVSKMLPGSQFVMLENITSTSLWA
jgi:hypothetical protein